MLHFQALNDERIANPTLVVSREKEEAEILARYQEAVVAYRDGRRDTARE